MFKLLPSSTRLARPRGRVLPHWLAAALTCCLLLAGTLPQAAAQTYTISTLAGNGTAGFNGDGVAATSARLYNPAGVAVDGSGNVYIVDQYNNRIRKVTATTGVISTVAGTGTGGFSGDGGAATNAQIQNPVGVAVDGSGNIYIADQDNQRIRKVTATTGVISTIVGTGTGGFSGDGGAATNAQLNNPVGVAVDGSGNVYIVDYNNNRIRKVTATTGVISTIAAALNSPTGVAVDGSSNVYIADQNNQRIRKVTATTGVLSTIAGTGTAGFSGDGGAATSAQLKNPIGVAVDGSGNVYIADQFNHRIRKVSAAGVISTIAGTGTAGFSGDGGAATSAQLYYPAGVAVSGSGNVYIADQYNHRIRQLATPLTVSTGTTASPTAVPAGAYSTLTVTSGAVAQLTGAVQVTTAIDVQSGGTLLTNCQALTGAGTFALAAGGTLGICDANGLSSTAGQGAVRVTGTRTFAAGASYVYNGTAVQNTGDQLPATVLNLTTTNPNTVTLSQAVSVTQILTVGGNGDLVLNNKALTLLSTSAGTALVVNSGQGVVSGNTATVQRYIDASGNTGTSGYRHYSPPVSGSTVADLTTTGFTPVVNPAYNSAANTLAPAITANYPTVYAYDQSRVGSTSLATNLSAFDQGYVSPAALTDALNVTQGYTVQIGNQALVDFTGTLTTGGQITPDLARNRNANGGWQLIGNPYPAPLDWGTVDASQLYNVDPAAYVFQSTSGYAGKYTSFVNGVGAGTGLIATGQGFFVRVSSSAAQRLLSPNPIGNPNVFFSNTNRVTTYGATPKFQRQASTRPLVRLSLGLGSLPATVASAQDETFVYLEAGATSNFDGAFDAAKLLNPNGYYLASPSTDADPQGLSINGRAPLTTTDEVVPLWLSVPAGSYTLTSTELANFAPHAVLLRDALTGTLTDLSTTASYSFSVAANAAYAGRFSLVLRGANALATNPATAGALASLYPNPTAGETTLSLTGLGAEVRGLDAVLLNSLGQQVRHYRLPVAAGRATQALATTGLASGVYVLRVLPLDAQGAALGTLPAQRLSVR
ncbi:MAG: hypothetical protein ACRYFX_02935 [Janthinobacterium lividum]